MRLRTRKKKLLAGRYELLEEIGAGGMGTVHRARDTRTQEDVAVKLLHPFLRREPNYVRRLTYEAEVSKLLHAPEVVRMLDVGHDGDDQFLVMEYVPGRNLREILQGKYRLDLVEALSVALDVARALEEAHDKLIVHRDIKPQNILVAEDGKAKVTDFGIARAGDPTGLTATGSLVGSVHYMAPEALNGQAEYRSDIYSLGVVLYEMLTGELPFEGETVYEVMRAQMERKPASLPSVLFGGQLVALVSSCLAKDPEQRPQSAASLAKSLSALLADAMGLHQKSLQDADGGQSEPSSQNSRRVGLVLLPAHLLRLLTRCYWSPPTLRGRLFALGSLAVLCALSILVALWMRPVRPEPTSSSATEALNDAYIVDTYIADMYIVQMGDTLGGICARLRPTVSNPDCVEEITRLNVGTNELQVGQQLRFPGATAVIKATVTPKVTRTVVEPSGGNTVCSTSEPRLCSSLARRDQSPGFAPQPTPAIAPEPTPALSKPPDCEPAEPASTLYCVYTIQPGDTISRIAAKFGLKGSEDVTPWQLLVDSNKPDIASEYDILQPGQNLRIPTGGVAVDAGAGPVPGAPRAVNGSVIHIVLRHETLSDIAHQFGVSASDIIASNNLASDWLSVGQELLIPNPQRFTSSGSPPSR